MKECLINLPPLQEMDNPFTINHIINHQARGIPLQSIMRDPDNYQQEGMQGIEVICKIDPESDQLIWNIAIPECLVSDLLKWYHLVY